MGDKVRKISPSPKSWANFPRYRTGSGMVIRGVRVAIISDARKAHGIRRGPGGAAPDAHPGAYTRIGAPNRDWYISTSGRPSFRRHTRLICRSGGKLWRRPGILGHSLKQEGDNFGQHRRNLRFFWGGFGQYRYRDRYISTPVPPEFPTPYEINL